MKKTPPLFSILVLSFLVTSLYSQITNTRKWRSTENDSMQAALMMFDDERYLMALPIYQNLFNQHPKEEYLKYCYGKSSLARSDKHDTAYVLLSEIYVDNRNVENIEYDLARAAHYNYKFDEAIALLDKFMARRRLRPEIKAQAAQLKQYCLNGKILMESPTKASITNAGPVLNSGDEDYSPVISADESVMIYTYRGKESTGGLQNDFMQPDAHGSYFEDAFMSVKENGQWTKPVPIASINTNGHDAPIALSPDGQQLFLYRDDGDDHGDLYQSRLRGKEWSVPEKLRGNVNSYSWEGNCSLTANGRQLYFSSERGGGKGGRDIYRATLQADSTWGQIVNLGDSINTEFDDDAPFIHPDGVTLFYSSKGKNSMGGYDIFQVRMKADSTWGQPQNLNYPINTPDDDIYYVLSANGERGYYASGKKGGSGLKDIYVVDPGYVGKKPSLLMVKGKITEENLPVDGTLTVEISSKNNQAFGKFTANVADGHYLVSLPTDADFTLHYSYKSYAVKTETLSSKNKEGYSEKEININFSNAIVIDSVKPATVITALKPLEKKDSSIVSVVTNPTVLAEKKKTPKPAPFVPRNTVQKKIMVYAAKYGEITAEGLIFKVQIAAYKYPRNYTYNHLRKCGKIEHLRLGDGVTRITIGGDFADLFSAFEHNKKVVKAGQRDAFVTAIYNGKRVYLEQLEKMGIYKKASTATAPAATP